MSVDRNSGQLDQETIARLTEQGHWPPPQGIIFVSEKAPDPKAVARGLEALITVLPPHLQVVARQALIKTQS